MIAGSMDEVVALENEIRKMLPSADIAASEMGVPLLKAAVIFGQDLICNAWNGPGSRLDRLRTVAAALRPFVP